MELPLYISEFTNAEWLIFWAFVLSNVFSFVCLFLTLSKKLRYAIPSRVNCWFCNVNTKVPYDSRNNWNCPNCKQYNGFTKDGGYNKRIPAQYIESLNRPVLGAKSEVTEGRFSNGLCCECNLNQKLKCFQLASFVPSKESKFDKEIEIEQKRLEEVYELCASCKSVVNRALTSPSNGIHKRRGSSAESTKPSVITSFKTASKASLEDLYQRITSSRSGHHHRKSNVSQFSDTEDEEENNMKMEKLQIGSPSKSRNSFSPVESRYSSAWDLNLKNSDPGRTYSIPPSPPLSITPSCQSQNQFGSCSCKNDSPSLLWKDYPLVQTSPAGPYYPYNDRNFGRTSPIPPSQSPPPGSFYNYGSVTPPQYQYQNQVANCSCKNDSSPPLLWKDYPMVHTSPGIPSCYYAYHSSSSYGRTNSPAPGGAFYNYRSTSMATVFGGRRPLICGSRLSSPQTTLSERHQPSFVNQLN